MKYVLVAYTQFVIIRGVCIGQMLTNERFYFVGLIYMTWVYIKMRPWVLRNLKRNEGGTHLTENIDWKI